MQWMTPYNAQALPIGGHAHPDQHQVGRHHHKLRVENHHPSLSLHEIQQEKLMI